MRRNQINNCRTHRPITSSIKADTDSADKSGTRLPSGGEEDQEEMSWEEVLAPPSTKSSQEQSLDGATSPGSSSAAATVEIQEIPPEVAQADRALLKVVAAMGVAMFAWLYSVSEPGSWRYYLAGGICAAVSHTIPVPIDVVKTKKQVDPTLQNMKFLEASKQIVEKEGMSVLLAGLGPTTFGYLLEGAMKFGVYEALKPLVKNLLVNIARKAAFLSFLNTQLVAFVVCGAISGLAAATVLSPMEALRIRLVAEPDFAPKGWIQGGYKMLKNEGATGLAKGIKPMVFKQVPYTVVKNVSFDFFAKHAYSTLRHYGVALTATIKFTVPLLSAVLSSMLSCISSQPGDLLLSLINAHGGNRRTRDIVKDILHSERGFKGFFVGMQDRILHVGLIVTLQLLLYDIIKRLCGITATGLA